MASQDHSRTGGQILVDALARHGVDTAFCVAGESYLAVLDALYDHRNDIRLITCRHEAGATNMAEAYAKLTGRPGVAMVTRGPGACHGSIGLHTGLQDSTPMVLLIGQVARDQFDQLAGGVHARPHRLAGPPIEQCTRRHVSAQKLRRHRIGDVQAREQAIGSLANARHLVAVEVEAV